MASYVAAAACAMVGGAQVGALASAQPARRQHRDLNLDRNVVSRKAGRTGIDRGVLTVEAMWARPIRGPLRTGRSKSPCAGKSRSTATRRFGKVLD
jgi:hypothetical protein